MASIPAEERSSLLKPIVFELYEKFAKLIMESKSRAHLQPLRYMLQPWLDEKELTIDESLKARRAEMLTLGIDGASVCGPLPGSTRVRRSLEAMLRLGSAPN